MTIDSHFIGWCMHLGYSAGAVDSLQGQGAPVLPFAVCITDLSSLQEWLAAPTAVAYADGRPVHGSGPSSPSAYEHPRRREGYADGHPRHTQGRRRSTSMCSGPAPAGTARSRRQRGAEGHPRHRASPTYADGHPRHTSFP
jgi:hypothetical protein